MTIQQVVIRIIWGLFTIVALRAWRTGRLNSTPSSRMIHQFLFCCIAITFWGEEAERQLDQYFWELPIAAYIKYGVTILACHLFNQMIGDAVIDKSKQKNWVKSIAPIALPFGVFSLFAYALYQPIDILILRYSIIAVRDVIIFIYAISSFIPNLQHLRAQEQIPAMRLKFSAILIGFCIFGFTVLSSTAALIMLITVSEAAAQNAARFGYPFVLLESILFMFVLIPFRWLNWSHYLQQFYQYQRIRRTENYILTQCNRAKTPQYWQDYQNIDLATYRSVISILDHYPVLQKIQNEKTLYQQIHEKKQHYSDYPELVKALAQL